MKRVLIAGASGMIGKLILQYCMESDEIGDIVSLVRKLSDKPDKKVKEVTVVDFKDYADQPEPFKSIDAAFFCIGAYTGSVPDDVFKAITVDYAIAFANALKNHSPESRLCLLSGAGADRTEKSRVPFAKYKGMAENQISALSFEYFYCFRPSYIYPVEIRKEPSVMYGLLRFLYPLIKLFGDRFSIKSTELAKAMFLAGLGGEYNEILENKDILAILK